MESVLISIQPKWCELIANGKKTVEVRKTKPKLETPFKVYIYCTKGETIYLPRDIFGNNALNGKVIGEFICDKILDICIEISSPDYLPDYPFPCTGLTDKEIMQYLGNEKTGYGWHIVDLVIYDKPKELRELKKINRDCWYADLGLAKRDCPECQNKDCFIQRPPQSWCYVEGLG